MVIILIAVNVIIILVGCDGRLLVAILSSVGELHSLSDGVLRSVMIGCCAWWVSAIDL